MSHVTPFPPRMFDLEGTVLGFLGGDRKKPKSIAIEVEQEQLAVQLPKEIRSRIQAQLKQGDRVRCIGYSKIDHKAGVIKLKAYQLFTLPTYSSSESQVFSNCSILHESIKRSEQCPQVSEIVVCRESACRKKGSEQMIAAVEQALHNYQLHEKVKIQYTSCQKQCSNSPSLTIMPAKIRYDCADAETVSSIIEEHFCS